MSDPPRHAGRLGWIRTLRSWRVRAKPEASLGGDFAQQARTLAKTQRRLGGAARAWERCCPQDLLERTAVQGVSRGVLTVRAVDSSTRFEIDRWLRSGGQEALVRSAPTTIRKVKVVVGQV